MPFSRSGVGGEKILRILFVSVEVSPMAKVGGLADVAGSLPKALADRGHDVRVLMPAYPLILDDPQWGTSVMRKFPVRLRPGATEQATAYQMNQNGAIHWLIGGNGQFDRCTESAQIYAPGRDAYLFLARAAMELCEAEGWIPDVVHANDWHTGFFSVLIREQGGPKWENTGCVYTIHNLAYQGEFGADTLDAVGLPRALFNFQQLETYGSVNFLKAGCVFSDQVNTVSPTYAREIETPAFGCRLEGLMTHMHSAGKLRGILNGIGLDYWNPATDPLLTSHFSAEKPEGKADCRDWLIKELGLHAPAGTPVVGMVSRLSDQKGFDLVVRAAQILIDLPMTLVILGHGDPAITTEIIRLSHEHPGRIVLADRFDEELAHRIYAGSDAFLMPSAFEPCGLGQMIALRYGTIPVVRRTGGLADTIFDNENGFVFESKSVGDMILACEHMVRAFQNPARWQHLMNTAMTGDYGWSRSAAEYETMYNLALAARRPLAGLVG